MLEGGGFGIEADEGLGARRADEDPGAVVKQKLEAVEEAGAGDAAAGEGSRGGAEKGREAIEGALRKVDIIAQGPEFAADAAIEIAELLTERSAAGGHHLRDQEAGEDAILLRDVMEDGEAGAFLAADEDAVAEDQRANIFEADRRFVDAEAMERGDSIEEMRGGDAACGIELHAAGFDEVIVEQAENVIGRDEGAIGIEYAVAIRIAIGGEAGRGGGGREGAAQASKIFFGGIGAGAIEEDIAGGAARGAGNAVRSQGEIQIAGAAAVQGVIEEADARIADEIEANQSGEALEVGGPWIKRRKFRFGAMGLGKRSRGRAGEARFDIACDLGQGRAAIGAGKFQAIVIGWIVAGGEVDSAGGCAATDFKSQGGGGRGRGSQRDFASGGAENFGRGARKFGRQEAGVESDQDLRTTASGQQMRGDGAGDLANA